MRIDPYPQPFPRARFALMICLFYLFCLSLPACPRAQSFADRVHRVAAPAADSAGEFRGIARWGGRLFVLHEAACFWSADGGRAWARQDFAAYGPKGRVPLLPGAWFARSADGLWLNSRDRALAWRFDSGSGNWLAWDPGALVMAATGWGTRLYALTPDHRLRMTGNSGDTWAEILLPAAVKDGAFFDNLLVEGDHLVLGTMPSGSQPAAYSLDGGSTWDFLAPRAAPLLAHGRLYAFRDSQVTIYRDGAERVSRPAPPTRAAFADSAGALFSLCDSGLFVLDPAAERPWLRLADAEEMRGWSEARDLLYRREGGVLAWFDGLADRPDGLAPAGGPRGTRGHARFGFDPGGRGTPWIGMDGGDRDPLGRRIRIR
jgi:hypothetical protein